MRKIVYWAGFLTVFVLSCKPTSTGQEGSKKGASGGVTVELSLPNKSSLVTQVADIETRMNAYQLQIYPQTSTCSSASTIDKVGDYPSSRSVSVSLNKGCSYLMTISVGNVRASGQTRLDYIYYKNNETFLIADSRLNGQPPITISPILQLQAEGRAIGLSTSDMTTDINGTGQPQIGQLASTINISLTDNSGLASKLSDHFTTYYLMIDFSQFGCSSCIAQAVQLNGDPSLQQLFTSGKCDHVTLLNKSDLAGWLDSVGTLTSFSGKHSFAVSGDSIQVAQSTFQVTIEEFPVYVVIDRTGKIVVNPTKTMPIDSLKTLCL